MPQPSQDREPEVTASMRPAPYPNSDETRSREDRLVADPICDELDIWWKETARKNREIFTELFRPLPTNLVRDWPAYDVGTLHLYFYAEPHGFLFTELPPQDEDWSFAT